MPMASGSWTSRRFRIRASWLNAVAVDARRQGRGGPAGHRNAARFHREPGAPDRPRQLRASAARVRSAGTGSPARRSEVDDRRDQPRASPRVRARRRFRWPRCLRPIREANSPSTRWASLPRCSCFVIALIDARPNFALTRENSTAVAQVCRDLDGIPLALELAAARIRAMSPEAIAAHLTDRFALLKGGDRTALPRQQTLRATIDWSYDLLAPEERALLQRLSVFAGGFALDAAEAVGAGNDVASGDVLDRSATWSTSRSLRSMHRRSATTCWRRCASTRWSASPRRARKREPATGISRSTWSLRNGRDGELNGPGQAAWRGTPRRRARERSARVRPCADRAGSARRPR